MATDYILFVHGVQTHNEAEFTKLADKFIQRLQASINDESRTLKPIFFFWGDLNLTAEQELLRRFEASPKWKDFWYKNFRKEQVLSFVGDAALYLSRYVGSEVIRRFQEQALGTLKSTNAGDRLHLVSHSWGAIVLFDILFSGRWDDPGLDLDEGTKGSKQIIQEIRDCLYGLPPNTGSGIPLASIHTLGAPISLFSLLNVSGTVMGMTTHDITRQLRNSLEQLYNFRQKLIPWRNFIHPGDPIAYPLEGPMPLLLNGSSKYIDVIDVIVDTGNVLNMPFRQTLIPLAWGGTAHQSYWDNKSVAKAIAEIIRSN